MSLLPFALVCAVLASPALDQLPRVSPPASASQTVGTTVVTVTYGSPGVKGRVIWGDLVPYGQVWRTGANEATVFAISDDVFIEGHKLAAGRYSLHTIPGERSWTVIFNGVAEQWGSFDYDSSRDALRIEVKPRRAAHCEWLRFDFPTRTLDAADLVLHWDTVEVGFTIKTDVVKRVLTEIDAALAADGEDATTLYRAAEFCLNAGVRVEQARTWLQRSIALAPSYLNLQLEANLLAREGRRVEAIAMAERALALNANSGSHFDATPVTRSIREWRAQPSERAPATPPSDAHDKRNRTRH